MGLFDILNRLVLGDSWAIPKPKSTTVKALEDQKAYEKELQIAWDDFAKSVPPKNKTKRKPNKKTRNPTYGRSAVTKARYKSKNDGTAVDRLIASLEKSLPDGIEYSISGITSHPRGLSTREDWIKSQPNSTSKYKWYKHYKIGLLFSPSIWQLEALVEELRKHEPDSSVGFYNQYRKPLADRIFQQVKYVVSEYDPNFKVTVGIKSSGKVSGWIDCWLPISTRDLVVHCGNDLTDFPKKLICEFDEIVNKLIRNDLELFMNIYKDYDVRYKFFRKAEQAFRKEQGAPKIGEGWTTQVALYKLIKKFYPKAIREYSPKFLQGQRYDIYIASLKLAIEYHGTQHYEPVSIFGGEAGFSSTVERDNRKKELSKLNGVTVVEWPHTRPVNESEVEKLLVELKALNLKASN